MPSFSKLAKVFGLKGTDDQTPEQQVEAVLADLDLDRSADKIASVMGIPVEDAKILLQAAKDGDEARYKAQTRKMHLAEALTGLM